MKKIIVLITLLLLFTANFADAQVTANVDSFRLQKNTCTKLYVLANDTGIASATQPTILYSNPQDTLTAFQGYILYCPMNTFVGVRTFGYQITDGFTTDSATVTVNILEPNAKIYKGDADGNGLVENYDALMVGVNYKEFGPNRKNIDSLDYVKWYASKYAQNEPGRVDATGDGLIDLSDISAIHNNYNKFDTIPYVAVGLSPQSIDGIDLFLIRVSADTLVDGDTLTYQLVVNSKTNSMYGFAFSFTIDTTIMLVTNDIMKMMPNNWLYQNNSDSVIFGQKFFNKFNLAYCKTNHQSGTGNGGVLEIKIPIDDNVDGLTTPVGYYSKTPIIFGLRAINEKNQLINYNTAIAQSFIYKKAPNKIIDPTNLAAINVYPNPASGHINIEANDKIESIELINSIGNIIDTIQPKSDSAKMNLQSLASGFYLLKIKTNTNQTVKRIFVH